jgi:long-chain acyl-CoA synthetase
MIHTSGTTSNPKRVMLTNENLISNSKSIIKSLGLKEESRTLIVLPMFLASANTSQLITHLYLGATITIMNGIFLPNRFYKILQEDKITNFTGVPTILGAILDFKPKVNYDISSLEKVCFGGGVVPTSRIVQFEERFPKVKFIQMYGQTEASTRLTHLLYKDSKRKLGSIGKAIPDVQIRIVDNGGTDVSIGQVGEIIAKGPNIMKGYYKREEETKNTLKDGWLFTGDLGRFDEEGYIYITGRKKNIIICGGMNIYPEEIEELIMNLSFVKEVCIVGKEDQTFGEVPVAKIVLYDAKREELKNEIINYCAKNLSSYKIPAEVIFVDELAKTDSGKVKRR